MKARLKLIVCCIILGMTVAGLLQLLQPVVLTPVALANSPYVILDPGHGGNDPGAPSTSVAQRCGVPLDLKEKDRTLDIARRVRDILQANGIRVGMTRNSDTNPSLSDRTNYINKERPNLVVSIHANSADSCGDGVEAWYSSIGPGLRPNPHTETSRQLAQRLALKINQTFNLRLRRNNGTEDSLGNLHMVREPVVPSALIEMAFISNPTEALLLRDRPGDFAWTIAQAIMEQLGITTCSTGQYRAEYYNNRSLSGNPTFTRCEGSINYNWGGGGPGNGVGNDNFSVRWKGRFNFSGGNFTFIARADDGIRVWVDGNPIIDAWRDQAPTEYRANRSLSAGEHEIKVEYYENGGGAVAQVRWEQASITCPNQYRAEYYNNRYLSGSPTFVRCENWPINHDWGSGGPGNGVGNDNFSVRWTGRAHINSGDYTFIARADDGIRVWVGGGSPIIDAWRDQAPTEYRVTRYISNGDYDIKVEYYENGGGAVAQFRWQQASSGSYNRLVAKHSGRCMDVYGASRDNGAAIIQWDCHSGDNQAWSLVPAGNDYYKLVAKHSGKCLDVYGASRDNGARLIQWNCHGGDNQLFKREQFGSYYRLRAKHSNRCVDVYGAQRDNGVRLIQWDCHGGDNQLWAIQTRTTAAQDGGEELTMVPIMNEYILPITDTATTAVIEHTVQEDDSLELMVSIYEVSIGTILEDNPELRGLDNIQPGTVLRIPVPVPHYEIVVPLSDARQLYLPIVVR